jgi:hypothetical protein
LHTDALVRQSERPGRRRPGEKRDEVAAFHLMASTEKLKRRTEVLLRSFDHVVGAGNERRMQPEPNIPATSAVTPERF